MNISFHTPSSPRTVASRLAVPSSGQTAPRFGKDRTPEGIAHAWVGVGLISLLTTAAFFALFSRVKHDTPPRPQPVQIQKESTLKPTTLDKAP